jgi:hypothetical protein
LKGSSSPEAVINAAESLPQAFKNQTIVKFDDETGAPGLKPWQKRPLHRLAAPIVSCCPDVRRPPHIARLPKPGRDITN